MECAKQKNITYKSDIYKMIAFAIAQGHFS